jgi:hypothetical protein
MSFAVSPSYTNATVGRRAGSLLRSASAYEAITTSAVERSERSTAARAGIAQTRGAPDLAAAWDELHKYGEAYGELLLRSVAEVRRDWVSPPLPSASGYVRVVHPDDARNDRAGASPKDEDQHAAPSAETSAPPGRTDRPPQPTHRRVSVSGQRHLSKHGSSSLVVERQVADHEVEADTAPTLPVQA